jgi:tyrosyl-tRNA synthetase
MPNDFVADLQQRGMVYQMTSPDLAAELCKAPVAGYAGFDPSAPSLHVGSLIPALALARLQRSGHRPIALVGGGTGMIGDPSGKHSEREMLDAAAVARNVAALRGQLGRLLDTEGPRGARLVDNAEWLGEVRLLDFLRDIGKHFTVNQMIARDAVRPRLEDPGSWISFTEFAYVLLQAYDFLALFDRYGCTLQLGGSDQWGNIVSGCDLIRRKRDAAAHGLTMPLLTKSDGSKFGKSEAGNVWLDPELTSPYRFYQFWLNTADADVMRCLRWFTFLPAAEIDELAAEVERAPQARQAQRVLAGAVTDLVHGRAAREQAERTAAALFGGDWRQLSAEQLADAFAEAPRSDLPRAALGTPAAALAAVVAGCGLCPSRGQARQAIASGAISVNAARIADPAYVLTTDDVLAGCYVVLQRGKKTHHVLRVQ